MRHLDRNHLLERCAVDPDHLSGATEHPGVSEGSHHADVPCRTDFDSGDLSGIDIDTGKGRDASLGSQIGLNRGEPGVAPADDPDGPFGAVEPERHFWSWMEPAHSLGRNGIEPGRVDLGSAPCAQWSFCASGARIEPESFPSSAGRRTRHPPRSAQADAAKRSAQEEGVALPFPRSGPPLRGDSIRV